ncbi:uncharacterized protein LOC116845199 [Odontomachus brunneus]|uniref:uncharacterized protein LOC116845199 n=1 Tax=Odontomachus brunneus TaxID=486640 RepID=UPI0013F2A91F|nr:uncharacterized protein LOC116845199 [Odontomachus brunneus]
MRNKSRKRNGNNDKSQKTANKDAWRVELDATSINDDRWWCIATMMVETTVEHSRHVSLLNETAEGEKRTTRVCYLSRGNATATVKTLSEEDPEKCPVVQRICHYANALLSENNGDLSAWLMARVVKYLIYRAKIEHGRGTRVERDFEILASSQSAIEGPGGTQRVGAGYVSDGKGSTRQRSAKDVPFHEPDLYVVLSGFHDPDLPVELLSVGVPLTCILQIKLPGEPATAYRAADGPTFAKKTSLPADYRAGELLDFWTITNRRFSDPSTYPAYSNIAVLTFCPPLLPRSYRGFEKRSFMRDTYDEMSRTLRHLHHLHRQHANYLGSMKLEKRILETRSPSIDTRIYEDTLSDISNECIDVPLILCAMLLQVEANLAGSPDEYSSAERNAELRGEDTSTSRVSQSERMFPRTVRDKLERLDHEYELREKHTDRSSRSSDIELTLHGDTLSAIVRHIDHKKSIDLVDGVLRILQDPRITNVWRDHEAPERSKAEMYSRHLDSIAKMFDRERTVSREEMAHYLHLLMFDKLIFSGNKREEETRWTRGESSGPRPTTTRRRRSRSAPNLTPPSMVTCSLRGSDTAIDYGGSAVAEWSLLFALTDTRETLLPGYLYKNVLERRSYERPTIEEYEDVELLSGRVFPQVARECFQSFDRFAVRYFEPTDSALLYFSNNNETDDVLSEKTRRSSSIRTPVRFHDFCKYIVREEENWMKRREMRETRQSEPTGRFMKEPAEVEDDAIIFDDECFVLPDSLKARHLREWCPGRDKISETSISPEDVRQGDEMTGEKRDGAPMTGSGNERADVRVTSGKTSMTGKKSGREIDDADTAIAKKILSPRCAGQEDERDGKPRDFLGYDLGCVRVQVTHRGESFFLSDGITVRIEVDNWLYGDFDLRVAVALRDCTLRLSGGADRHRSPNAFHLTTRQGIVLGFRRSGEPGIIDTAELAARKSNSEQLTVSKGRKEYVMDPVRNNESNADVRLSQNRTKMPAGKRVTVKFRFDQNMTE